MIDYYTLLNLPSNADQATVEASLDKFKKKVNLYGPGVTLTEENFEIQFPEINQAYKTLCDPILREEHDRVYLRKVSTALPSEVETPPSEKRSELLTTAINFGTYAGFALLLLAILYGFSQFFAL